MNSYLYTTKSLADALLYLPFFINILLINVIPNGLIC